MAEQTIKVFLSYHFDTEETSEIITPDDQRLILKPAQFVHRVNHYLNKQANLESFCYTFGPGRLDWDEILRGQLDTSDRFVFFCCGTAGEIQRMELKVWREQHEDHPQNLVLVRFFGCRGDPDGVKICEEVHLDKLYARYQQQREQWLDPIKPDTRGDLSDGLACECAKDIYGRLGLKVSWIPPDGLPVGYPFDYEKDIIAEFVRGEGRLLTDKRLEQGCPLEWPALQRVTASRDKFVPNPIPELVRGKSRRDTDTIIVDGRSQYHSRDRASSGMQGPEAGAVSAEAYGNGPRSKEARDCCLIRLPRPLTFLEAGPREKIVHPLRDDLRIGIVVSGGIAPGINAVIAGICARHITYRKWAAKPDGGKHRRRKKYKLTITMYRDGFFGVLNDFKIQLEPKEALVHVNANANLGGSWISTARHDELLDSSDKERRRLKLDALVNRLSDDQIDILYVIGGEGTMRAAHAVAAKARQTWLAKDSLIPGQISVVGIPKTMDNDVLWVWQAFGFLSAVEKAKEFISQLDTEAKSNPRLCIVQLFGSDSGFVVSHAALASGVCRAALIPEVGFTMARFSQHIRRQLARDFDTKNRRLQQSPFGIILLAETAIPRDVEDYIDNPKYPEVKLDEEEKEAIRRFVGSVLLNPSDIKDPQETEDLSDVESQKEARRWLPFLQKLAEVDNADSKTPAKLISELLPEVVRKAISVYRDSKDPSSVGIPSEIQALVIKALNSLIKPISESRKAPESSRLYQRAVAELSVGSFSRELRHFHRCMEVVDKARGMSDSEVAAVYRHLLSKLGIEGSDVPNPLDRDPVATLQALSTYPLPYEAKAAVHSLIERMSREYLSDLERLPSDKKGAALAVWIKHFKGYNEDLYEELLRTFSRLFIEEVFEGHIRRRIASGDRRVHGQTPDALRSGGLKIVSAVLQHDIRHKMLGHRDYWKQFRVFVNEPRHLIRAISPSVSDVIFGQRLGMLAVDNAMAGYTDFMVSQWLTEYVLVPLDLVVLGRKRVPRNGIFWKGVLQNTGQPPKMLHGGQEDLLGP
jgi:6-phosphofructokinase